MSTCSLMISWNRLISDLTAKTEVCIINPHNKNERYEVTTTCTLMHVESAQRRVYQTNDWIRFIMYSKL